MRAIALSIAGPGLLMSRTLFNGENLTKLEKDLIRDEVSR